MKRVLILMALPLTVVGFQNCSPGFVVDQNAFDLGSFGSMTDGGAVRRLSNLEYKNSLPDVVLNQFSRRINNPDGNFVWDPDIYASVSTLPIDPTAGKLGTDQMAASLSPTRFGAYIDIAFNYSRWLTADANRLKNFAGACATNAASLGASPADEVCVNQFITDFATIAFRIPPTAAEIRELKDGASNWQTLIGRTLIHPRFLTHFERERKTPGKSNEFMLTDYEIEARLAAVFWKSSPDLEGLAAAKAGKLSTAEGLAAEVSRILSSPKAKAALWVFYQQWLATSRLPQGYGYSSGETYDAFASPFLPSQLDRSFKDAVLEDGRQLLDHLTWTQNGTLRDVFTSPLIFTTDARVASVYGVSARANISAPAAVDVSGHYRGILTRPLITQQKPSVNGETNHILRGVFVLTNLLGQKLGNPANFAEQQQAELILPAGASTRLEVSQRTSFSTCIGCHAQINPSGFAFSNFDSLGRYTLTERRFKMGTTQVVATNPINGVSPLSINGVVYTIKNVDTLVDALFASGQIYEGFANYYFSFAFGRTPESSNDVKMLNALKLGLKTKSIREALTFMAMQKEFATAQAPTN